MIAVPVWYVSAVRAPSSSTPLTFAQVIVAVCAAVAAAPFVSYWRVGHGRWAEWRPALSVRDGWKCFRPGVVRALNSMLAGSFEVRVGSKFVVPAENLLYMFAWWASLGK